MDPKKYNCGPPRGPITPAEAGEKVYTEWAPNLGPALLSEMTSLYPTSIPFPNHPTETIHSKTYAQMLNSFFGPPITISHGSLLEKAIKKQIFKPIVEKPSKLADEPYRGEIVVPRSETISYFKHAYSYPEYIYFSGETITHKISGPPPPIIKKPERKLKRPSYLSTRRKSTKREKRFSRPLRHRVARLR